MLTLQILIASTRPGRQGPKVAAWFQEQATRYGQFQVELVDLAERNLPVFDEPKHPRLRQYEHAHTQEWSAIVERADAFVVVTPEYNYTLPASLVNAFTYLVQEWAYKPMGFVSYGGVSGGLRAVQSAKPLVTALNIMPLPGSVALPLFNKFIDEATGEFRPEAGVEKSAQSMLAELLRWATALKTLRQAEGNGGGAAA